MSHMTKNQQTLVKARKASRVAFALLIFGGAILFMLGVFTAFLPQMLNGIVLFASSVPMYLVSKPVITYTSNINNNIDTSNNLQPQQDAQHLPNKSSLSQTNAIELEHNLHMQINNFRAQNGLKLLAYDEQLAIIAREHSKDMAVNNYYDHTSTNEPPPKRLIIPPLFGPVGRGNKSKKKSGPTGLVNLNVNNIFSSSLSISVNKNRRYEF